MNHALRKALEQHKILLEEVNKLDHYLQDFTRQFEEFVGEEIPKTATEEVPKVKEDVPIVSHGSAILDSGPQQEPQSSSAYSRPPAAEPTILRGNELCEVMEEILFEKQRPLTGREMADALIERNITSTNKNFFKQVSNLLWRHKHRFVNEGHGYFLTNERLLRY